MAGGEVPLWKNQSFADLMLDAASPARAFRSHTKAAQSAAFVRKVVLALSAQSAAHAVDACDHAELDYACAALTEYEDFSRMLPHRSRSGDLLTKFLVSLKNRIKGTMLVFK